MRKLLRHGRNSKPSSGGSGGGDEVFVTLWTQAIPPLENVYPLVSMGTVTELETNDFGWISINDNVFVNHDPLDISIFGNFPEGTTINFSTYGFDYRGVESINGTSVDDYHLDKTITIGPNYEVLDEDDNSWEPKQYSPYLFDDIVCTIGSTVYIPIVMIIKFPGYSGTSIGGLDIYFNNVN